MCDLSVREGTFTVELIAPCNAFSYNCLTMMYLYVCVSMTTRPGVPSHTEGAAGWSRVGAEGDEGHCPKPSNQIQVQK